MATYPSKLSFEDKENRRPVTDRDGQLAAEEINEIKKRNNDNALFHDVHDNLAVLQEAFPNPPKGAFAYLKDTRATAKCITVGWEVAGSDNAMRRDVYDTNESGVVDNSERLGGNTPNYFESKNGATSKATTAEQNAKNYSDVRIGGLKLVSNQALQEIYIRDADNNTLSTISVAFLNNEGTSFIYNEATGKLELRNDANELLSELPVSSFVSNLANSIGLNGSTLSLKDTEGNNLATVTFTINNVQGLQQALSDFQQANADMLVRIEDNEDDISVHEQRLNELPENVASSENVATAKQEAIADQKIIAVATSRPLADIDHKAILMITASVTLTNPGNLRSNFTCDLDVTDTGQVTINDDAGDGSTLDFPSGKILQADKMGTIYMRPDNGLLRGKGEFSE